MLGFGRSAALEARIAELERFCASLAANIDTAAQQKAKVAALESEVADLETRLRSLYGRVSVYARRDRGGPGGVDAPEPDDDVQAFLGLQNAPNGGPR